MINVSAFIGIKRDIISSIVLDNYIEEGSKDERG